MKLEAKHFAKDRFYVPTHSSRQVGLYKLLIKSRGIAPEIVCECLDTYFDLYLKSQFAPERMSNSEKKYYTQRRIKAYTIEHASGDNFDKFLKIVTEKTGQTFKTKFKKRRNAYDDWYAEASMDGTLAYSGVTDDF